MAEIRRFFGKEPGGGHDSWQRVAVEATQFDLDKAEAVKPKGHVVAVRVTSEDPDDGFNQPVAKFRYVLCCVSWSHNSSAIQIYDNNAFLALHKGRWYFSWPHKNPIFFLVSFWFASLVKCVTVHLESARGCPESW